MEIRNLMVGDWVNIYTFPNDNPKQDDLFPAKVSAVSVFDPFTEPDDVVVELVIERTKGIASRPLDTCLPIPLTEEILVKNGFKFQRHEFKTTNDDYWISDDKRIIFRGEHMTNSFNKWSVHVDTEDMRTMAYLEITYVHQLQHLLRLVGVQKEIEL